MYIVFINQTLLAIVVIVLSTAPMATQNSIITGGVVQSESAGINARVSAVAGGEADLPCDSRPPQRNDSLLLIVWYRDDHPVYSYDTRVLQPHWSDEPLTGRAHWLPSPQSALRVRAVGPRDGAVYRCRVDFQVSPTRNYRIALDVVELPSKPVIFDEYGKEISGIAGPYNEGGDFKLICSVTGGNPTPRVQWLQGDTVLATLSAGEEQVGARSLTLLIRNATRAHLAAVYTCTADNTQLAPPLRATVRIDLYLRPLTVEIVSRELPLSVGRVAELWCKSTGARPPATLTWWLDGRQLNSITKLDPENGNETQSLLKWTPLKEHNGHVLACRADHPRFNHSAIESKLTLNIFYVPVARIQLGSKMNPNDIEEGDDVYFGCEVDANPAAYKVVWDHNGTLLSHKANSVIITGNTNLALRSVSRKQAGLYGCTASNVEGDGRSPPLHLHVVYRPVCRTREPRPFGAAMLEPATVRCEVDAYPPPHAFEWTLNNTAGSVKVDPDRFTMEGKEGHSVLTYTPASDSDYGTLACRATNLAGQQTEPCVYTLLPATRPSKPSNCTVYNLTDDSMDLLCVPGYDGGLHCVYILEVWAQEGLVVNISTDNALWNLRRLGPDRQLKLIVYAANARGRSDHLKFTVETAPRLSPRTEAQAAWEVSWALGGVLGAAGTVAIILCLALVATRLRHRTRDYEVTIPSSKIQKASLPKRVSPHAPDDRNPDLIPLSKVETMGPWSGDAVAFSREVGAKLLSVSGDPLSKEYFVQRISLAIQHGNAASVMGLAECPEPPPYASHSQSAHSLHDARGGTPRTPLSPQGHHDMQSESGGSRSLNGVNGALGRSHREVVTTRTPLLAAHQESCV